MVQHENEMDNKDAISTLVGPNGAEKFGSLYKTGIYSDVTVRVTDAVTNDVHEIPAHKCILALKSPVWEAAIKWSKNNVIEVNEFPKNLIKLILEFVYNNEVNVESLDVCLELIQASDFYCISKLLETCVTHIQNLIQTTFINVPDFIKIFNTATLYELEELIMSCIGYIQDNSNEFFKSDDFFDLSQDTVTLIAIMDKYLCSEFVLIQSVLRWSCKNTQAASLRTFLLGSNIMKVFRFRTLHLRDSIKLLDKYMHIFNAEERYSILKSLITNEPIELSFLDSNNLIRGDGNIENDAEIIVGSPPMVIHEEFRYIGGYISIPVYSIVLEPRRNTFMPKCDMNYEECVTINVPGYSMDFDGIASRSTGTPVNIRNPIQIQLMHTPVFKVEIILRRSGVYKKTTFHSLVYAGLIRMKKGLIRDIIHCEKIESHTHEDIT